MVGNVTNKLVDAVIEKIEDDVGNGDTTAIEELLQTVPIVHLVGFLPEEDWSKFGIYSEIVAEMDAIKKERRG